ncbi:DUF397 domain-containing protein [Streptomyces phaeochromogenes]|uniref:DUF397 domain-containing protein n=2 Tax=Streptomyces phaeochromogenes TaxID=1923 RepID=UPI0039A02A40
MVCSTVARSPGRQPEGSSYPSGCGMARSARRLARRGSLWPSSSARSENYERHRAPLVQEQLQRQQQPGDCVEIAPTAATIHVRDSKNAAGPRLTLSAAAWSSFVAPLSTAQ